MNDLASEEDDTSCETCILLLLTGGTICMQSSLTGLEPKGGFLQNAMKTRPSFNDSSNPAPLAVVIDEKGTQQASPSLRTPMSAHMRKVRYCIYEWEELLDSSAIDSQEWARIANVIYRNYKLFDGFVVLHGTDTMAYTCSALSFMFQDLGKPIILTGSQSPIYKLQNDATDNLLGSMIIAGHFSIPEVCLFFNYKLFRGNRTTKTSATDFDAFSSPNLAPLATTSSLGTKVLWHLVHRPTTIRAMSLQPSLDTASVACLRIFPGIRAEMVDAVLKVEGLRGLVLETFGAGNAPSGIDGAMTRVFADAVQRGIVIVNVTQCLKGNVSRLYAAGNALIEAGVLLGKDQTTESALTKLAYLLASPNISLEDIRAQMSTSLRGELTESLEPKLEHPNDGSRAQDAELAQLATAIMDNDSLTFDSMLTSRSEYILDQADYMGNTPLHIAVLGPNEKFVRKLMARGSLIHTRNKAGHTPLYLAVHAQKIAHASILRDAGAHLQPRDELYASKSVSQQESC